MQIILLSKKGTKTINFSLTRKVTSVILVSLLFVGSIAGYFFTLPNQSSLNKQLINNTLTEQRLELLKLKQKTRNTLDGLAVRVGQVQARLMHLNAVGEHLVKKAKLSPTEFDFDALPAQGGSHPIDMQDGLSESQLMLDIQELGQQMGLREKQLELLDQFMLEKELAKKIRPAGLPVEKGWLSSNFGNRIDPFHGRKTFHRGVDIAGKSGTNVLSVASGLVAWVGVKSGYGVLIEIDHGDGYITRYAHNKKSLVVVGEAISQGQVIAKMGSTGRSTGPHVHFEVVKDGKQVNPRKYLYSSR